MEKISKKELEDKYRNKTKERNEEDKYQDTARYFKCRPHVIQRDEFQQDVGIVNFCRWLDLKQNNEQKNIFIEGELRPKPSNYYFKR